MLLPLAIALAAGPAFWAVESPKPWSELGLTIAIPALEARETIAVDQALYVDRGVLLGHRVEIAVHLLGRSEFDIEAAEDLTDLYVTSLRTRGRVPVCSYDLVEPSYGGFWRRAEERGMRVNLRPGRLVPGPYGADGFAAVREGSIVEDLERWPRGGDVQVLAGVLADSAYLVEVVCKPLEGTAPQMRAELLRRLRLFLATGVRFAGPARDPRWSRSEIVERWHAMTSRQGRLAKKEPRVLRTEHYIVIGDASFGDTLGRALERIYSRVQHEFPFPEWSGRRLMPVFLFRNEGDYLEFAKSLRGGNRGVAFGDAFATWYDSPEDPVLAHEAVHQLFRNRLRLAGGGSWFQEGLAESLARTEVELRAAARELLRKGLLPLGELIAARRVDELGRRDATERMYLQAGLFILYLRERAGDQAAFQALVARIGALPPGRTDLVDGAFLACLGADVSRMEEDFRAYLDG